MKPPFLLLLLLLSFILFLSTISQATVSPGSTLYASNPNQTWTSPNNTFSLGFVPAPNSPNTHFAAITYDGILVWIAGGSDSDASDSSASLQLLPNGNLRLVNGSTNSLY